MPCESVPLITGGSVQNKDFVCLLVILIGATDFVAAMGLLSPPVEELLVEAV